MSKRREQRQRTFSNRREVESAAERIIPDDFVDAYDADSIPEALRHAEQAPAHDAADTEDRECPRCSSVRIKRKTGADSQQTHATDFVCTHCRTHFDDPEHPETADIVFSDSQTQLGRWSE